LVINIQSIHDARSENTKLLLKKFGNPAHTRSTGCNDPLSVTFQAWAALIEVNKDIAVVMGYIFYLIL